MRNRINKHENMLFVTVGCVRKCLRIICDYSYCYLLLNIIMSIVQGIYPVVQIYIMQKIINFLQEKNHSFETIAELLFMYILINILSMVLQESYAYYKNKFSLEFEKFIGMKMLKKASKLKVMNFENTETYNLIARAQSQNGSSILFFVNEILNVIKQIIMIGSTMFLLVRFRWWLIIIVMIISVGRCMIEISIDNKWYEIRKERTQEERKIWYINFLFMTGKAFKEIKVLGLASYFAEKYEHIVDKIICQDRRMQKIIAVLTMIIDLIDGAVNGCIYMYIMYLGYVGKILIGDVTSYIECVGNIKDSTQNVFTGIGNIVEQSLYINLFFEFLEIATEEKIKGIQIDKIRKIELKNVSFKYSNGKYALKNINITLNADSKTVFVGENGSGKSTLIKIIMGLYDNYEGDIFVNNVNMKDIDLNDYHKKIGCIFQDYVKYELSVRENIAFGNMQKLYDDQYLLTKMDEVGLGKGEGKTYELDTIIGSWFGGTELSIGEWQRIAIARALTSDAEVYIFDEPDASLDVLRQKNLIEIYKKISENKIGIYVSHRINSVQELATQIVVMDKGKIVEKGTHNELMKIKGEYWYLYNQCENI